MVMALAVTAFGADYAINHRDIFFFDTIGALLASQRADGSSQTGSCASPGSAAENRDLETVAEGIALKLEFGYYGEENVLSDETDFTSETMWERRRVTVRLHDDYGQITNAYLTGEAYADRLVVEGLLDWDLSAASESMTPDEGGQLVTVSRDSNKQTPVMANAPLGYTTDGGKRFQIEYQYDMDSRYLQEKEYILSAEYDDCCVYTTSDQVEVLLEAYDGQIWASAVNVAVGNAVSIYTTGCTASEMESVLDNLKLADAMNAGI